MIWFPIFISFHKIPLHDVVDVSPINCSIIFRRHALSFPFEFRNVYSCVLRVPSRISRWYPLPTFLDVNPERCSTVFIRHAFSFPFEIHHVSSSFLRAVQLVSIDCHWFSIDCHWLPLISTGLLMICPSSVREAPLVQTVRPRSNLWLQCP